MNFQKKYFKNLKTSKESEIQKEEKGYENEKNSIDFIVSQTQIFTHLY